jgi:hypothetical protein
LTNASATIKANSFAVDLRKDLEEQISDIEGAADEAAKTATNYLYFDTNGLQVGYKNSSGGWAGNRT